MDIAWGTDNELTDSQFYNRVDDINMISNLLNSSTQGSTPTIFLTGIRGVGKTALIRKIKRQFDGEFLVIYVDLSKSDAYQENKFDRGSVIRLLYDCIIKECEKIGLKTFDKKIKKIFKTNDISIDKIINYNNIPIPIPEMNENYTKLANFVINLPQEIYDEYKSEIKGVFVFFDEFQLLKELDQQLDSFLWFLRSNIQDQKNVAYVLTGSMSLKDDFIERVAGNSGAFGGRILTLEITPFSYETTKSYLEEKAGHLNFTEDGFKQFYNCTRGIPTYINTFAKCLPQNVVLDKDRLKKEFKGILPILAMHYINLWYELTNQEQKIITCLLENPLKRKDLAEKLDVTTGSISKPLKKLQNLILIELDNKEYRIADPILKLWLDDYYDKYQIYPYRTP